jgi:hypothetical protein
MVETFSFSKISVASESQVALMNNVISRWLLAYCLGWFVKLGWLYITDDIHLLHGRDSRVLKSGRLFFFSSV